MFNDIGSPPLPPTVVRGSVPDVDGGWGGWFEHPDRPGYGIVLPSVAKGCKVATPRSLGWFAQCGNLWTIGRWLPLLMITHSGVRPTGHPSLDVAPGKTASSLGPNATEGFRPQGRPTAAEVHPGELRWGKWMGAAGSARCVLIDRERPAEVPGDCRREVILPLPVQ